MKKEVRLKKNWKGFVLNILSPAFITIVLFNVSIFAVIIPTMKRSIVEKKKETIKELTLTIISELTQFEARVQKGELTRVQAQNQAKEQIKNIRYGSESKDYFWISDATPVMIMHPYRNDLNGKDVSNYSDASGKKLFVEFARVVKERDEGYVDYLWQWKDNPQKIVPKLSYVKIFRPWGWIIGTGIYLEDVRSEISNIGQTVIIISILISCIMFALLFIISSHSLGIELRRQKAESALRESEEKYRLLVESSAEGMVLTVNEAIVYSNKKLQEMLGYSERELGRRFIDEIIIAPTGRVPTVNTIAFPDVAKLRTKDDRLLEVICTNSSMVFAGENAVIYTFKDVTENNKTNDFLQQILTELQTSLLMSNTPIKAAEIKKVECAIDCSIKQAVDIMSDAQSTAILVRSASGHHIGIVTDSDLRERVLQKNMDLNSPLALIMSSPLIKISDRALFFEATNIFLERGIHHIAVVDENERIVGILGTKNVLQAQRHPAAILIKEIEQARTVLDLHHVRRSLPSLVKALLDSGAKIESVTRIISTVSDTIINKLISLGQDSLGPAPLNFSFISFGSVAREEQTLKTDQDNGIIYDDPTPGEETKVQQYFLRLGEFVCANLDAVGYDYCSGAVMAQNSKWCRSISQWKKFFTDCISSFGPQDLLDINVFLDLRSIHGEREHATELRELLRSLVKDRHELFYHLAQSTLQYRPPLSFFGNIQLESQENEQDAFNIKSAIVPIVNFARIYALKNGIDETSTISRLEHLLQKNILLKSSYDELIQAFSFLMQMRMAHQAQLISAGHVPDNFIDVGALTQIEQSLLKKILSDIVVFQAKMSRDFIRVG